MVTLTRRFDASLFVGLGAFPAPTPHTRPARVAVTASTAELAASIGFIRGSVEVPSGIEGVLEQEFADAGIPAIGLWARVPHYAAAMPYPAASLSLVEALMSVAAVHLPTSTLETAAAQARTRIDNLIANSDEHVEMVRQLETQHDRELVDESLPTGDEIAAELERFLRGETS